MQACYVSSSNSLRDLSREISQYLWQHENMEIDRFLLPNGEYRVQGQVRNYRILRMIGWDKRVVVRLRPDTGQGYTVTLEAPVWEDKVTALAVSLLGLWPLSFAAAWGILDQLMLFHRLRRILAEI